MNILVACILIYLIIGLSFCIYKFIFEQVSPAYNNQEILNKYIPMSVSEFIWMNVFQTFCWPLFLTLHVIITIMSHNGEFYGGLPK